MNKIKWILMILIVKSKIKEFEGIYPIMIWPNDYSANKKRLHNLKMLLFDLFWSKIQEQYINIHFKSLQNTRENQRKCILSDISEKNVWFWFRALGVE